MQWRATSKKRAAEMEKEINMDDKEATPVEDLERPETRRYYLLQNPADQYNQRNKLRDPRKQGT